MSLIAGRFQPLDAARPGSPLRARDLQTAQSVMLRRVPLPPASAVAALARAQAARGIFHPSLVTLFEVVQEGSEHLLLAYEYVPAQTIAQVTGGDPLHPRRAVEIVTEIADAVAELHARDVAHGGILPAHVLLTMKGKAKLDRVGDASATPAAETPTAAADLVGLGELLRALIGSAAGAGAVSAVVARACGGGFASAATLAATLRGLRG